MSSLDSSTLISLGQVAHKYYLAMQAVKSAEARHEKAKDALRGISELNHRNFNVSHLYAHRAEIAHLKQLHDELKATLLHERRCRADFIKSAKENF